jgi:transcription termination factor Rho
MAYNIIELNEKLTTELRVLAKEMGIRRPDAYKKEELIYKILDEQAIAETKKMSSDNGSRQVFKGRNTSDFNSKNHKNKDNKSVSKTIETKKDDTKSTETIKSETKEIGLNKADSTKNKQQNNNQKQLKSVSTVTDNKDNQQNIKSESQKATVKVDDKASVKSTPEVKKTISTPPLEKNDVSKEKIQDTSSQKPSERPIQLVFRSSKHRNEEKKNIPTPVTLPPVVAEDTQAETAEKVKIVIPPVVEKMSLQDLVTPSPLLIIIKP